MQIPLIIASLQAKAPIIFLGVTGHQQEAMSASSLMRVSIMLVRQLL